MTELEIQTPAVAQKPVWYKNKLILLMFLATLIALLTSFIALKLYNSSSALLDVSRNDYASIRGQIDSNKVDKFEDTGTLDIDSIDQFLNIYDEQMKKTAVDQFNSKSVTNKSLGLKVIPDNYN